MPSSLRDLYLLLKQNSLRTGFFRATLIALAFLSTNDVVTGQTNGPSVSPPDEIQQLKQQVVDANRQIEKLASIVRDLEAKISARAGSPEQHNASPAGAGRIAPAASDPQQP